MRGGIKSHKNHFVGIYLLLSLAACVTPDSPVSSTSASSADSKTAPSVLTMEFQKGQVLSLISVARRPGDAAAAARKTYLQSAFGLASTFGLKPVGNLRVAAAPVGNFAPAAVGFFSWPDTEAEARFNAQPQWPAIKATRPQGWDELRVHDVVLAQDLTLRFQADKTYSMATAWINVERPDDYDRYLRNIQDAVTASGGRFIYQMHEPRFASLATEGGAPGRITFVEWDTPTGLAGFQKTAGFKENAALLQSGTTGFELLILAPPAG